MPEENDFIQHIASSVREASTAATPLVEEEENHVDRELDRELKTEKINTWRQYNETLKQNGIERKKYAKYIFSLTCIWAGLIFILIFMQGFGWMGLSDKVIIVLISSTTINFFGFFLLVTKYLFNSKEHILVEDKTKAVSFKGRAKSTGSKAKKN